MEEAFAITQATHTALLVQTRQMLAAYPGNEAEALELIEAGRQEATARGQGMALSLVEGANAVLFNGLGRYDEALPAAQRACAQGELSLYALALVELIEAAVRSRRRWLAATALERLSARTRASRTEWALGLAARSRALLTDGPSAEALYEEAVKRLARGRLAPHLARAQLVYGEWLRRENRRVDAREQLRAAHDTFSRIGAEGSPNAPVASSRPPARRCASAPWTRANSSQPRRRRSPISPATASPTPKSAHNCSSVHGRCSTTWARSSPSSTSPRATSSAAFPPAASPRCSRRDQ
jgi:hypothetical protein